MSNSKLVKSIILLVSGMLFLSACYPSGGQSLLSGDDISIGEQIEDIVSSNEHLEVDAEPKQSAVKVPKINVTVMEWDDEKLNELFLASRPDLEYYEFPSDYYTSENYKLYEDETSDEAYWLVVQDGFLSSEIRREFSKYGYGTMQSSLGLYRFEDYFTDNSISLFSKEEAITRCTALLEEVGITNHAEPEVYAIIANKANVYWENEEYIEYEKWTADDEVYILRFPIEYNNIPVTTVCSNDREIGGHGGYFVGSYIDFIADENEIIYMDCFTIFSPEYETGENIEIKCGAENALKIAAKYYDSIVLGEKDIKISGCELVYVPYEQHDEKNFTLIPMWRIDACVYNEGTDLMGLCDYLFIDVQTGNIIIW